MNLRTSQHDNTCHKQTKFGTGAASKASMAQKQPQCMRNEAIEPARTLLCPKKEALGREHSSQAQESLV